MGCSMIIHCNDNDHDNANKKSVLNVCRRKLSLGTPSLYWISRREITFQCSRHNVFHRRPEIVNGRQAQASTKPGSDRITSTPVFTGSPSALCVGSGFRGHLVEIY